MLASPEELRGSLGQWFLALNPSYGYVPFQQERLIPALERLAMRKSRTRKLMVQVHPGAAKSEIGTIACASWYMGNHPGHRVLTMSYGDSLAQEFGGKIRDICNGPLAANVFPDLRTTRGSRSNKHFTTEQNNEFYAAGFEGVWTGRRCDAMFIDDPCKDMEEAKSEREMKARFNRFRSVADARLRPGGIVIANLTRYGTQDWAARVLQHEGDEWEQLILDAENPDGTFLWEDFYGREKYESIRRKDPEVWWATWRQQPSHENDFYFDSSKWLTYDPVKEVKKDWLHYMICDPAVGTGRGNDRTSIMVFAAGPEKRLFIRDWILDRMNPDERTAAICRLIRKWHPVRFIYEEAGMHSDLFYVDKAFKAQGITIRPIPVGKKGPRSQLSKDARIRELIPDFNEGKLWFPPRILYKTVSGEVIDIIQVVREEEYSQYRGPKSTVHDDGLDVLARMHEPELRIMYVPSQGDSSERAERKRSAPQGSWESAW
jgi:hypothetical protein